MDQGSSALLTSTVLQVSGIERVGYKGAVREMLGQLFQ